MAKMLKYICQKVKRRKEDNGRGIDPNFECRNAFRCFALVRSRLWIVVGR